MAKMSCLAMSCSMLLVLLLLNVHQLSWAAEKDLRYVHCSDPTKRLQQAHVLSPSQSSSYTPAWAYKCDSNRCVKVEADQQDIENNLSLSVCRLFCGSEVGTLWPYPTGSVKVGNTLVRFDPKKVSFDTSSFNYTHQFAAEHKNLLQLIESKKKTSRWAASQQQRQPESGSSVRVAFDVVNVNSPFDFDLDQGYKLKISKAGDVVNVRITAQNAFGVRYALTTLSQLVVFDDFRRELLVSESGFHHTCDPSSLVGLCLFCRSPAMS